MIWLWLGVLVWSVTHFLPAGAPALRARLIHRLGEPGYKGIFSLLLVGAIVLMVIGWRSSVPNRISPNPEWLLILANLLVLAAFMLFVASVFPSILRRVVRHPQLTAVLLWGIAHVMTNRDLRSFVLFGGFGVWSILMILLLNRRDGVWEKAEAPPLSSEL
ncbi:MAG: NnrU family protein, partial [Myxococcota bacterium]|nr:NnrU family protein [Myxococcota bacterium]